MSDVKRWQFTLRGMVVYTALVALPLAAWPLVFQSGSRWFQVLATLVAVVTTGGALGAPLGWLLIGTPEGFWIGYLLGIIGIFVIPYLLIVVLALSGAI